MADVDPTRFKAMPLPLTRYTIDWSPAGYLGAGTYGTLYKGIDKETNKAVALKFVGVSDVFNHLVLRETMLLSYLAQVTSGDQPFKNPAISLLSSFRLDLNDTIRALPFCNNPSNYSAFICLVTPLYPHDCEKFRTYNLVSNFTLSQMIFLWYSLATCIRNLHRLGLAHRDIKPSNILLDSNGSAFLADFGMAKYCMYASSSVCNNHPESKGVPTKTYSPVSTSTTCTLLYRAPESLFNCYGFLTANGHLFTELDSVPPSSLDALGDTYALSLILLESLVSRVVFFLPLAPKNAETNATNEFNAESSKTKSMNKQNYYLIRMQVLLLQTYRDQIYDLFHSYCELCGYVLSSETSMDIFRDKVTDYLQGLLNDNIDSTDEFISFDLKETLGKKGPNLLEFVLCCIRVRFGSDTGRESELVDFAKVVANCLSLTLTERSTSAQLFNSKIFRGDKAHAQYVLGDCSTLGADSSQLKLTYQSLCSCLGTSRFLQQLRRYLSNSEVEEIGRHMQGRVASPSSLILVFEKLELFSRLSDATRALCKTVKQ